MDSKQLMDMMMWWIGISVVGFMTLAGWMWWLVGQMAKKVSYEWLESQFKQDVNRQISEQTKLLSEIRDALVGDMEQEGLISKIRRIEERCQFHGKEHSDKTR